MTAQKTSPPKPIWNNMCDILEMPKKPHSQYCYKNSHPAIAHVFPGISDDSLKIIGKDDFVIN